MTSCRTFILFFVILTSGLVYSQTSKELFGGTTDRFNYSFIRYVITNLSTQLNDFDNLFEEYSQKYGDNDTTYRRIRNSIPGELGKIQMLCDQIDSIKIQLPAGQTLDNLPYYLVYSFFTENYSSYSNRSKFPLLNEFYGYFETKGGKKFKKFKYHLFNKLKNSLYANPDTGVNKSGRKDREQGKFHTWILKNLMWILIGIVLVIFYLLGTVSAATNRTGSDRSSLAQLRTDHEKTEGQLSVLQVKFTQQKIISERNEKRMLAFEEVTAGTSAQDILSLKEKVAALEKELLKISSNKNSSEMKQPPAETANGTAPRSRNQQLLYFPAPDKKNGHFRVVMGKETIQGYSVYQFSIDRNNSKNAFFQLIDNPQVEAAVLNFPELYLHYACKTKGDNTTAKRIKTVKPGIALLEGDDWIIKEQAEIVYE